MGKPDKKLKKTILILGITGAVYGVFRYLLPLIVPFLFAYLIAWMLKPSAKWMAGRCRVRVRGNYYGIPAGAVGAIELMGILAVIAVVIYFGGKKLLMEAGLLIEQIPVWISSTEVRMTEICHKLEGTLCMQDGDLVHLAGDMTQSLLRSLKGSAMPYVMVNSMTWLKAVIQITVFLVILIISTALIIQEIGNWKRRCRRSIYQKEFDIISKRLAMVVNAYLKTQGIIMLITSVICIIGFWLLKNPYYFLAGIGIGLLDALPVFGTGTVLIPWIVITCIQRQWGKAFALLVIYLICYFVREILEARMMGDQVGLSPLETLISMYVGLQLFGIAGFLLGPIGLLLIMDLLPSLLLTNQEKYRRINHTTENMEKNGDEGDY